MRVKRCRVATPFGIVGRTLSRDATMLAKIAAPDDAVVARACAVALRDPERVARLLEGLLPSAAATTQDAQSV